MLSSKETPRFPGVPLWQRFKRDVASEGSLQARLDFAHELLDAKNEEIADITEELIRERQKNEQLRHDLGIWQQRALAAERVKDTYKQQEIKDQYGTTEISNTATPGSRK